MGLDIWSADIDRTYQVCGARPKSDKVGPIIVKFV